MGGLIASSSADAAWKGALAQERWLLQYGEGFIREVLAADPSALSPEPPTPDSPHVSLVCSALTVLEPRVSGYKENFLLAREEAFYISSHLSLLDRNPTTFHTQMVFVFLFWFGALG